MNPCIVSFHMNNIDKQTVEMQRKVVEKFNKSNIAHYSFMTPMRHGASIDYFWGINGVKINGLELEILKEMDHDIILFLDLDCIPLNEYAIDSYINLAADGKIAGNAQRSGHIENNQHVFAAPSATAIHRDTFMKIGCPSALETNRGDVLEEYTYNAEKNNIQVDLFMPLGYDSPPKRMEWESNYEPFWRLADGMPNFGIGTTYGTADGNETFYHNFQIFHPGNQELFRNKCERVLSGVSSV